VSVKHFSSLLVSQFNKRTHFKKNFFSNYNFILGGMVENGVFLPLFSSCFFTFFCQFHMISGPRKENISTSHAIYHENWSNQPFMNILWPPLKTLHSGRKTPVIGGRIRLPGAYCISALLISVQKVQHKHLNAYCLSSAFVKHTVKYAS